MMAWCRLSRERGRGFPNYFVASHHTYTIVHTWVRHLQNHLYVEIVLALCTKRAKEVYFAQGYLQYQYHQYHQYHQSYLYKKTKKQDFQ